MRIRPVLLAATALAAAALTGVSASGSTLPFLRSVSASNRHVVALFKLGDLLPGQVLVAVSPKTSQGGKFLRANVRLDEPLRMTRTARGLRARTRHALRPGRYYVEVSGVVVGVDCLPSKPCPPNWSNVRRVVIRP